MDNPADGEVLCEIADASPADGMAALDAAVEAQASWGATRHESAARSCGAGTSC